MNIHLVSDYNIEILKRFLQAESQAALGIPPAQIFASPVSQSLPYILQQTQTATFEDAYFLLSLPETLFPEFKKAKGLEPFSEERLLAQIDEYADTIRRLAQKSKFVIAQSFRMTFADPGYGLLDWKPGIGLKQLLAQMNLHFARRLGDLGNFYLVDSDELTHADPTKGSAKLWYAAKSPFANLAYKGFVREIIQYVRAIGGHSRRLIILDLDQTLWGGVVGETGWSGVRIGGHDHVGEAFKEFQLALKALTKRGVQLALVSKNDESVALEAIDKHPEMILRREDFAGWKINWNDKASNIANLLKELNLGAASAVFIDDNPVERERVKMTLPQVLVPDWPEDPALYVQHLYRLRCFDTAALTEEDRSRTQMYTAERSRKESRESVGSVDNWLESIATKVSVAPIQEANLPRVAQLFNKTNQLNLATRRLSALEIKEWAAAPNRAMWAVTVSDRFGDLGLTGVLGLERRGDEVHIVDYILSCRVMGRMVEETMFHLAIDWARAQEVKKVIARYLPTERNRPTLEVLHKAKLHEAQPHEFIWNCAEVYAKPTHVELVHESETSA